MLGSSDVNVISDGFVASEYIIRVQTWGTVKVLILVHITDSLKHRVAAAEAHLLLCPDAKSDAIKIIVEFAERYA